MKVDEHPANVIVGISQINFGFAGIEDARGLVIAKCIIDHDPTRPDRFCYGLKVIFHQPHQINGRVGWCWWDRQLKTAIFHYVEN